MTFSKTIFLVGLLPWFVIIFRLFSSKKNILIKSICLLLANSLFIIWGGVGGFLVLCIFSFVISLLSFLVLLEKNFGMLLFYNITSAASIQYSANILTYCAKILSLIDRDPKMCYYFYTDQSK